MRVVGPLALATCFLACSSPQMRQVKTLMQAPVAPASDAIFNAVIYTNGQLASSPQTDAEWDRLKQHARNLTAAAGTLKALAPPGDPAQWIRESSALEAASSAVVEAIDERSLEGVIDGGGRMYDTCTACHAAYVKDP